MSEMGEDPSENPDPPSVTPEKRGVSFVEGTSGESVVAALGELAEAIGRDESVRSVVQRALSSIAKQFRISHMMFYASADNLKPLIHWETYGYSPENAEAILKNLETEYYPKHVVDELFSEANRVTRRGYFIPGEVWLGIVESDPFSDVPAYYRHPEEVRTPRKDPEEWQEADSYLFALRDNAGRMMAWLELDNSIDDRLLSKETVQEIEVFVDLITLSLLRERLRSGRDVTRARAAQKTELLEDVLKISSSIVSERDLAKLSDMILASVSSLFGFRKVTLVAYDESEGVFKWLALFGYSEDSFKETRYRTIPTDVVLDDLKESKRVGKSVYYTPFEEMNQRQLAHFVMRPPPDISRDQPKRDGDEFRPYDCLAFSLHDASGRIVGVIYPSDPKDGRMPDNDTIETMEIFTSLAEVALESARLSGERELALRTSGQRTEQLSRILDMTSGMMYVRDMDKMLEDLLRTLAQLLGIRRMVMGVKHDELGEYRIEAVYGYSAKAAELIKKVPYKISNVDSIHSATIGADQMSVRWKKKIGRMTYYIPAESQIVYPEELPYYPEPELLRLPRRGKDFWHEADWINTFIFDRSGKAIAYLEILKPRDDRIPDSESIEIIEIFASLAGISIENARVFEEHKNSRRDSELYTDILSHDIKNYNQAILGYLELLRMKLKDSDNLKLIGKISEQVMNTIWLAGNVRTMSKVSFSEIDLSRTDLGEVLFDCRRSVTQYYPGRKIKFNTEIEPGHHFTNADELIRELFTNIMTNAVKYDSHDLVEIDINVMMSYSDDKRWWTVSIGDHGWGIPDDVKEIIFERFSKAPKKKGSGLGLHIVKTLTSRYGGRVWVEDRVQGDPTQGSVFKVQLPASG